VEDGKAKLLVARYMEAFIKPAYERYDEEGRRNMPWCWYKVEHDVVDWTFDANDISSIDVPLDKKVYCHDERGGAVYEATYGDIYDLIIALEPWEEVDIEVFDDGFEWTVAFTHECQAITHGVRVKK